MARILCVWELGSNLGHLSNLRLPVEIALQLGHDVYLAARQLHRIREVMGAMPLVYLQAPFKQNVVGADQSAFLSFTHLMARQCFSDATELEMYLRAWQAIFDLVRPDLVLFEHSPTALIASLNYRFKKVQLGTGFSLPPQPLTASAPFAPFSTTPNTPLVLDALRADDAELLKVINEALRRIKVPALASLPDIYAQTDAQFLMTLPVMDHFGERVGQRYLGVEPPAARQCPKWPAGDGTKVFGYLHAIPSLEILLQDLQAAKVCALLYVCHLPPRLRAVYTSDDLSFAEDLLDLTKVAQQAAWVINHGNHNTAATFVQAGVPQLLIPMHQEHLFAVLPLVAQGCAVMAYRDQPGYAKEIMALESNPQFKQRAAVVRAQCPSFSSLDAAGFVRQILQILLV